MPFRVAVREFSRYKMAALNDERRLFCRLPNETIDRTSSAVCSFDLVPSLAVRSYFTCFVVITTKCCWVGVCTRALIDCISMTAWRKHEKRKTNRVDSIGEYVSAAWRVQFLRQFCLFADAVVMTDRCWMNFLYFSSSFVGFCFPPIVRPTNTKLTTPETIDSILMASMAIKMCSWFE